MTFQVTCHHARDDRSREKWTEILQSSLLNILDLAKTSQVNKIFVYTLISICYDYKSFSTALKSSRKGEGHINYLSFWCNVQTDENSLDFYFCTGWIQRSSRCQLASRCRRFHSPRTRRIRCASSRCPLSGHQRIRPNIPTIRWSGRPTILCAGILCRNY